MTAAEVYGRRATMLSALRKDVKMELGARASYKADPVAFISDWIDTHDARLASVGGVPFFPFRLWPRQCELVEFIKSCITAQAHGLVEKSRDVGATWVCVSVSLWLLLFWPGVTVGWGTRKAALLDRTGDPNTIFEKMRLALDCLPKELLPKGWDREKHCNYCRIVNPEISSAIIGESGDQIGRGGRTLIYFKDESAHYEHPEAIEAALSHNTRTQIDISSVSGMGTIFQRKRESGHIWSLGEEPKSSTTNVFVFDWRDDPRKDQAWYEAQRTRYAEQGLLHIHAQEVDRDYSAALRRRLIAREWVRAAVGYDAIVPELRQGGVVAGLDVADEGGDKNALVIRKGLTLTLADVWAEGDPGATARRALGACMDLGVEVDLQYDCVGVGAGVKAEYNRLSQGDVLAQGISFTPWNAGSAPLMPEDNVIPFDESSPLNREHYQNLKAQAWWSLRQRLERTWRARVQGEEFNAEDLIAIDSGLAPGMIYQLEKELCQVEAKLSPSTLKQVIDKAPQGVASPNVADAVVMCYFPLEGVSAYSRFVLQNIQ